MGEPAKKSNILFQIASTLQIITHENLWNIYLERFIKNSQSAQYAHDKIIVKIFFNINFFLRFTTLLLKTMHLLKNIFSQCKGEIIRPMYI